MRRKAEGLEVRNCSTCVLFVCLFVFVVSMFVCVVVLFLFVCFCLFVFVWMYICLMLSVCMFVCCVCLFVCLFVCTCSDRSCKLFAIQESLAAKEKECIDLNSKVRNQDLLPISCYYLSGYSNLPCNIILHSQSKYFIFLQFVSCGNQISELEAQLQKMQQVIRYLFIPV